MEINKKIIMNSFASHLSFQSEKLGTGIRKVFKYSTLYTGKDPVFNENDLFEVIVPVIENTTKETENITKEKENTTKETKNITKETENTTKEKRSTTKETENITKETEITTKEKESLILSLLATDPRLTATDLAHHIVLSSDGVRYYLKKLKATGKLEKKGSTKGGSGL